MVNGWIPCSLAEVYAVAAMFIAGYSDLREREVEPLYWVIAVKPGIALLGYCIVSEGIKLDLLSIALAYLPSVAVAVIFLLGWMGGADLAALLFLATVMPRAPGDILPFPVITVIYTVIPSILHRLIVGLRSCEGDFVRCVFTSRFMVRAEKLLFDDRYKWWLVTDKRAGSFDISLEPHEVVVGIVDGATEEEVEAAPGLPYVLHLAIAAALAAVIGDKPLVELLLVITGLQD